MTELLRVENLHKRYGHVSALSGASFSVRAGEVHALMGENGAGKSTLARIAAGAEAPDEGVVFLDGRPVSISSPLDAQRYGIAIVFQELDLFPHLSAAENIVIGNLKFASRGVVSFRKLDGIARPFLDQVGFARDPRTRVGELSIGEAQLVAIARALSMDPRVLLLDEPTSSLFDDAAENLFRLIGVLKRQGIAVVDVSHKMDEVFRISDRITVLRDGATIGTRETSQTSLGEIVSMMAGREVSLDRVRSSPPVRSTAPILLSVSGLTTGKLRGVSFDLRAGEVLGIAGLVGAGRSELGAALFGLDPIVGGAINLGGRPFRPRSVRHAMESGIGLLPEDRKDQGLMMGMSVRENATMASLARWHPFGLIRRRRELEAVEPFRHRLALRAPSLDSRAGSLSGGNQQKVLLMRWLLADPGVLFLDDPARGIDIGAKHDIYRMIEELGAAGKGIILVSSELPELLRCADRILVLNDGRATATFTAAEATQEKIVAAAALAAPRI